VDGNDIFSVYYATRNAIERARKGEGATLIEAVSYRMSMHTTADDPTRYRTEKETEEWKAKDPVERMRKYLKAKKIITERQDKSIWETAEKEVDQAIKDAESFRTNYKNMFEYVYAKMPQELTDQLTYLEKNKE
jgi:pyruvate dehydrogenase E1 component alpha subunit